MNVLHTAALLVALVTAVTVPVEGKYKQKSGDYCSGYMDNTNSKGVPNCHCWGESMRPPFWTDGACELHPSNVLLQEERASMCSCLQSCSADDLCAAVVYNISQERLCVLVRSCDCGKMYYSPNYVSYIKIIGHNGVTDCPWSQAEKKKHKGAKEPKTKKPKDDKDKSKSDDVNKDKKEDELEFTSSVTVDYTTSTSATTAYIHESTTEMIPEDREEDNDRHEDSHVDEDEEHEDQDDEGKDGR